MTVRTLYSYDFDMNQTFPQDIDIEEPRQCMHCDQTGVQNFITGIVTGGQHDKFNAVTVFTCPLCSSSTIHFLVEFNVHSMGYNHQTHQSIETIPVKKDKHKDISADLETQFPDFFEIYYQSEKAEEEKLDKIAGMGYRKSLEYLVTDYLLKYQVPNLEEDWIKNPRTTLSMKISKIPSERMQILAKAASFLGNDETHYTRRHPEHDVQSLKAFIRVLLSEIQNEIDYKNAEELINKPSY